MDELVKRLRTECTLPFQTLQLMREAADAIEELRKPRWIPVMEKLPEPFENILVANKRGKHYDIDKGWWNGTFFDRCAKGGYHNVTHWMPLPSAEGLNET